MAGRPNRTNPMADPYKVMSGSSSPETWEEERRNQLTHAYAKKIIGNMIDLTVWRTKMGDSMLSYIEKVLDQIYAIYNEGMNLIVAARGDYSEDVLLYWLDEKDLAEEDLFQKCKEMRKAIDGVIKGPGNNNSTKKQVIDLLEVMRKPKLPNIALLLKEMNGTTKKMHNKMRRLFSFHPKEKVLTKREQKLRQKALFK